MTSDHTRRFADRVDNYIKYRPGYPAAVLACLQEECGLTPAAVIADVGSGTGLLSRLFLEHGNHVFGLEPNDEMRGAAETLLGDYNTFTSVKGTAEATTLPDAIIDFATAGQAFHWFDPQLAGAEFRRILKPEGYAVLIWNERDVEGTPFMRAYEDLLGTLGQSYQDVKQRSSYDDMAVFFGDAFTTRTFSNNQEFDLEGLRGRLLSASYAPLPGHPQHEPVMSELDRLFVRWQQNGTIRFVYKTQLFFSRLA